jgi:hypothetical protein
MNFKRRWNLPLHWNLEFQVSLIKQSLRPYFDYPSNKEFVSCLPASILLLKSELYDLFQAKDLVLHMKANNQLQDVTLKIMFLDFYI